MLFVLLLFCYFDKLKFIIMIFKTPYYFSCKEYSYSLIVLCLIMLSSCQKDIQSKNINNIAAVLVHESLHLYFQIKGYKMTENQEEFRCYVYEMQFLLLIPNVEPWLLEHAQKQIEFYSKP